MPSKKKDQPKPKPAPTSPAHGGARENAGRKPSEHTALQRFIRANKVADAEKSWKLLVQVRDDVKQKIELRVDVAKYILNQVIGLPKQAVEVEGEMRAVLVGKSEWKP